MVIPYHVSGMQVPKGLLELNQVSGREHLLLISMALNLLLEPLKILISMKGSNL